MKIEAWGSQGAFVAVGMGLFAMLLGACGPAGEPGEAAGEEVGSAGEALACDNGLSTNSLAPNGASCNGLSTNGLSTNGLSTNGLSTNGLSTNTFSQWFNGQADGTAYSDMVMKYLVRCAVPAGETRTYKKGKTTYTWQGLFGLAPVWSSGAPIPLAEQQIVSACYAAHVNKFGEHVTISVQGYMLSGVPIPSGPTELLDYPVKEGCFFGNLFDGEGAFVGNDSLWSSDASSSRDCAVPTAGLSGGNCPPMLLVGACSDICQADATRVAYYSCTWNGTAFPAITTRISADIVYHCGDGVCQVSEHCGTGSTPGDCRDCGPCLTAAGQ